MPLFHILSFFSIYIRPTTDSSDVDLRLGRHGLMLYASIDMLCSHTHIIKYNILVHYFQVDVLSTSVSPSFFHPFFISFSLFIFCCNPPAILLLIYVPIPAYLVSPVNHYFHPVPFSFTCGGIIFNCSCFQCIVSIPSAQRIPPALPILHLLFQFLHILNIFLPLSSYDCPRLM